LTAAEALESIQEIVKHSHRLVILDIVEDNKVPIILGRPMLATVHARIDVLGGTISLEVRKEQVNFNDNEGVTPVTVLPVCAIKDFDVIDNIEGPDNLEEFLIDDDLNGDLGSIYKEVEFEVSSTRFHMVARFCLDVTTLVTT
nr:hypothetical protein [Tanacetum cinerariifolium]GEV34486.1 hypothetical protein [Tanacetum cinerariifolium]